MAYMFCIGKPLYEETFHCNCIKFLPGETQISRNANYHKMWQKRVVDCDQFSEMWLHYKLRRTWSGLHEKRNTLFAQRRKVKDELDVFRILQIRGC